MVHQTRKTSNRLFILGLGAQKCGTTWLYHYLSQADNFRTGVAKEYHVWDALDIPALRHKRSRWFNRFQGPKKSERLRMQRSPDRYFDYFEELLEEEGSVTADITPSYSGLTAGRLRFIREEFARRGITTRAILLVRDPLRRIKSAVRYNLGKGNYNEGIPSGETDFLAALESYYKSEACRVRTRYDMTIQTARSVFDQSSFHIAIYEKMFEPDEIAQLSEFCGVPSQPKFGEVLIKRTGGHTSDDPSLDADILNEYKETYAFFNAEFPETKQIWTH